MAPATKMPSFFMGTASMMTPSLPSPACRRVGRGPDGLECRNKRDVADVYAGHSVRSARKQRANAARQPEHSTISAAGAPGCGARLDCPVFPPFNDPIKVSRYAVITSPIMPENFDGIVKRDRK